MKKIFRAALIVIALSIASATGLAQTESREELLKQIEAKRAELSTLEKSFLAPSEADRLAYAEFLRQPNVGLIRLLPREVYAFESNRKALTVWEGGAYYSFDRRTHEYGSDIGLEQGYLSVGFAGANYGILSNLGSVSLTTSRLIIRACGSCQRTSFQAQNHKPASNNDDSQPERPLMA